MDNLTTDYLSDLILYYLGLAKVWEGTEENPGWEEILTKMDALIPLVDEDFALLMTKYLQAPSDNLRIRTVYNRALTASRSTTIKHRGQFVLLLLTRLENYQSVQADLFDGRARQNVRQAIAAKDLPAGAALQSLASLLPLHMRRVQPLLAQAAALLGSPLPAVEAEAVTAAQSQEIATEIKKVRNAKNVDPEAKAKKTKALQGDMDDLIQLSPDPVTAKSQAVAAVASTMTANASHMTAMGAQLGMTPDQEEAMVATGKVIIAAGAGSGKTRVLAGALASLIKEKGVSPESIIATSFSKDSAGELIERVGNYLGDSDAVTRTKSFGTTHSIANAFLNGKAPKAYRSTLLTGGAGDKAAKIAMAQIKMDPERSANVSQPDFDNPVGFMTLPLPGLEPGASPSTGAPFEEEDGALAGYPPEQVFTTREFEAEMVRLYDASERRGDRTGDWFLGFIPSIMRERILKGIPLTENQLSNVNRGLKMIRSRLVFPPGGLVLGDPPSGKTASVLNMRSSSRMFHPPAYPGVDYMAVPANQWFNIGATKKDLRDPDSDEENPKELDERRMLMYVTKAKADFLTPEECVKRDGLGVFSAFYGAYEWVKENSDSVTYQVGSNTTQLGNKDFDDMLIDACRLVGQSETVRKELQAQYRYLYIDESQDLNDTQHLFFGLLANTVGPDLQPLPDDQMTAKTFCFIGDDKQSIYAFRGASPGRFTRKSDTLGGDFKTYMLDTNFRSGSEIVEAANRLIAHNKDQIPMMCKSYPKRGRGAIEALQATDPASASAMVASYIKKMTQGPGASMQPKDFGMAFRTNGEARAYCMDMLRNGIPFRSKLSLFGDATSKAIINYMRLATLDPGPGSRAATNSIVKQAHLTPRFNVGFEFNKLLDAKARGQNYLDWLLDGGWRNLYEGRNDYRNDRYVLPYAQALASIRGLASRMSPQQVFQKVLRLEGSEGNIITGLVESAKKSSTLLAQLEEEYGGAVPEDAFEQHVREPIMDLERIFAGFEDLDEGVRYLMSLMKDSGLEDPNAFLDADPFDKATNTRIRDKQRKKQDEQKDAVTVMTIHGWKGLQCKHLFVPMTEGNFPHARATTEELPDERRLGYVALTRGEDRVTVISTEFNAMGKDAGPSQFVSEACIPYVSPAEFMLETEGDLGDPSLSQAPAGKTASVEGLGTRWDVREARVSSNDWSGWDLGLGPDDPEG